MMTSPANTNVVRSLTPLLVVSDIKRSQSFYCEVLGFETISQWSPEGQLSWCCMQRGGASLMLQQECDEDRPATERGTGIQFYLLCDDAHAIHAELARRGLQLEPPQVAFYGMNQLYLHDPDGYAICFQNAVEQKC